MSKIYPVLAAFSLFWMACGGSAVSSGKTLVDVNGEKITEGHLEFLSGMNPALAYQISTPAGKKQILDNLVEQELFYQAAKKEGIHRDPKVQAKIDLYRKVILAQAFVEAQGEKEAKKYYEEHKNEFEKLKLSHIMIHFATPEETKAAAKAKKVQSPLRSEQEALKLANKIDDQLKNGGKFEALAKQYSDDASTKEEGGNLGELSRNDPRLARRGLQPLLDKAFEMKVGEIAGPIKTEIGYHILTLTSPAEQAPFEAVKDQLLFKTRGEVRGKLLEELKQKGKIAYAAELQPKKEPPVQPNEPATTQPQQEEKHN